MRWTDAGPISGLLDISAQGFRLYHGCYSVRMMIGGKMTQGRVCSVPTKALLDTKGDRDHRN
jgi:hypothetical protein